MPDVQEIMERVKARIAEAKRHQTWVLLYPPEANAIVTEIEEQAKEIERLRDTFKAQLRAGTADLRAEIERQAKEIERLREALEYAYEQAVERWHEEPDERERHNLPAWLGLTEEEYQVFMADGCAALARWREVREEKA